MGSLPMQEHINLCDAVNVMRELAYTEQSQKQSRLGTGGQKMENEKPLGMMLSPYEQGEWDMFSLITSVEYGKQYYFHEKNGMVYSRKSHK